MAMPSFCTVHRLTTNPDVACSLCLNDNLIALIDRSEENAGASYCNMTMAMVSPASPISLDYMSPLSIFSPSTSLFSTSSTTISVSGDHSSSESSFQSSYHNDFHPYTTMKAVPIVSNNTGAHHPSLINLNLPSLVDHRSSTSKRRRRRHRNRHSHRTLFIKGDANKTPSIWSLLTGDDAKTTRGRIRHIHNQLRQCSTHHHKSSSRSQTSCNLCGDQEASSVSIRKADVQTCKSSSSSSMKESVHNSLSSLFGPPKLPFECRHFPSDPVSSMPSLSIRTENVYTRTHAQRKNVLKLSWLSPLFLQKKATRSKTAPLAGSSPMSPIAAACNQYVFPPAHLTPSSSNNMLLQTKLVPSYKHDISSQMMMKQIHSFKMSNIDTSSKKNSTAGSTLKEMKSKLHKFFKGKNSGKK